MGQFNTIPPNPFPPSSEKMGDAVEIEKDIASIKEDIASLETDVGNLNDSKANQITIAPFFSAETSYTAGDIVNYNGLTYRCVNEHEGAWDADDFAPTTISNELDSLKSGLVGNNEVLTIAANTYQTNQQALQALYTAYNALNYDTKIRCYIKSNDYYIFKISSINYGQFYRSYLVKSGNNFGIGFELLALANEEYLQCNIYDGASAGVSDLTTRAQTNKWALYY